MRFSANRARRTLRLAFVAALCIYAASAQANWGEVFIATQPPNSPPTSRVVDTMVLPDGTPVVGYTFDALYPALSFVETAGVNTLVANHTPSPFNRFEADRFGIISFAGSTGAISIDRTFGTDHGTRTQLDAESRTEPLALGPLEPVTDIALDANGVPSLVSQLDNIGDYVVTRFDIPSNQWLTQTVPSSQSSPSIPLGAYTADSRLVLSSASDAGNYELAIEQPGGAFNSYNFPALNNRVLNNALAVHGEQAAFAFRNPDGQTTSVGVFDGLFPTIETINNAQFIAPGSLAFAPDGTLSFVYPDQDTGDIIFAQRTAPGTWTTQSIGTTGILASLAFADDGTPYVGVASEAGVSLFSTAFPSTLLGDMNGDFALTNGDIAPFVQALTDPAGYASDFPELDPDRLGDFNGDQNLTNGDIAGFVAALTGSPSAVPEPGSLALLGLGALGLIRRRPARA